MAPPPFFFLFFLKNIHIFIKIKVHLFCRAHNSIKYCFSFFFFHFCGIANFIMRKTKWVPRRRQLRTTALNFHDLQDQGQERSRNKSDLAAQNLEESSTLENEMNEFFFPVKHHIVVAINPPFHLHLHHSRSPSVPWSQRPYQPRHTRRGPLDTSRLLLTKSAP